MYKRIFLLSGLSPFIREQVSPQIGIGYLAETLDREGFVTKGIDYPNLKSPQKLLRMISDFSPDLIGIHMMTHGYLAQYETIEKIRNAAPSARIIVGGPHASLFREEILKNRFIDHVAVLEGEKLILDFSRGNNPMEIPGLISRNGNCSHIYTEAPFIKDLDSLPFPSYKNFELSTYPTRIMSLFTSRGCPYRCTFCPVKSAIGCQFRARSAENVFDEIGYWYEKGYREFWIQDDNFTLIKQRTLDILELILKSGLSGLRFALPNGIRSDKVDDEMLRQMKRAGFFHIAYGVEAGNNKVLAGIKKGETIDNITKAIEGTLKAGIKTSLFFLLGSPGEKESDVEDSFDLVKRYNVSKANFYNIIPFPKTELFDYLKANNLLLYDPALYLNRIDHYMNEPIFITPELGLEKRKELFGKAKSLCDQSRKKYIKSLLPKPLGIIPAFTYPLLEQIYKWTKRF